VKALQRLGRFFSLRKYQKEIKLSPLFIETTVSILAGLFMLIWGVIFFSNAFYQYSLFTGVRNLFISNETIQRHLAGIYCLGLDPKIELVLEDRELEFTDYDLIADGIEVIGDYARAHTNRRIVIGVDFAFAASEGPDSFDRLIDTLAWIPENLFVVFGGVLIQEPETISFLRPDLLGDTILLEAAERSKDRALLDRIFLGNIHYLKGSIRSGFEGEEDIKAAVGYMPLFVYGRDVSSLFCSLALSMLIVGEVMESGDDGRYDFWTDFAMGLSGFDLERGIEARLEEKTGRNIQRLVDLYYYNFFTKKNISDFKQNFLWLSNHSTYLELSTPIDEYFRQRIEVQLKLEGRSRIEPPGDVEYFFVAPVRKPEFLLGEGEQNDIIITPASGRNAFTYEVETVDGVMAHITALSNLRNRFFTTQASGWVKAVFYFLLVGSVFLITWNNDLFRGLLLSVAALLVIIGIDFILFLFGLFVPLKTPLAISVMVFGLVSIARFMYTTKRQELYSMLASRVFSPSQMKKLMESKDSQDWQKEKIIEDGVIMVLLPKRLPSLGKTDEEAEHYTRVYERYLDLVFETIERYGGSHDMLSMDGVLGFWNVPIWEEGSDERAFLCAKECLGLVNKWQVFIDQQYGDVDERYTAAFDICLHRCAFYAGCLGTGEIKNYALSGPEVNFAISAAQSQIKDERSTIQMTETFAEKLKEKLTDTQDTLKIVYYTYYDVQRKLYVWDPDSRRN
jgi:hypothetical protein